MARYHRLSLAEREEISRGLACGDKPGRIARELGRERSTVSREIRRNAPCAGWYRAEVAQHRIYWRRAHCVRRRLDRNARLRHWVWARLRRYWSPEQIAATLKQNFPRDSNMRLSHEALYTYLYVLPRGSLRRELLSYLRQHRKLRHPRSRGTDRRGQIPEMISIEERPASVAKRTVPGHWEGDLLKGTRNQSAVGTLVERTTRTLILVPLDRQDAEGVRRAFTRELKSLPRQMKRTLTYDRGKEMTEHRLFTRQTRMRVYFAHPHSPWERGTNENTNGLLRQFFPKHTDFTRLTRRQIKRVQHLMNSRPRAVLNWRTPYEAFDQLLH
ncbi:MAG: IS30 family transposase [Gammaproteobacteria bacterium]